jgi:hypothetical protein
VEPVAQAPVTLPPDKVYEYIECKNGFAAAPRVKIFFPLNDIREDFMDVENAVLWDTSSTCRPLCTLCSGLLGGMVTAYSVGGGLKFCRVVTNILRPVRMQYIIHNMWEP